MTDINRVVGVDARAGSNRRDAIEPRHAHSERLKRLRAADAIVRQWSEESGFEHEVWQFPVVLIPIGAGGPAGFRGAAAHPFRRRDDRASGPHAAMSSCTA